MRVISKALENGLFHPLMKNGVGQFTLSLKVFDYIKNAIRVHGKAKTFQNHHDLGFPRIKDGKANPVARSVYSPPPLGLVMSTSLSDLIAAISAPIVFVIWLVVMKGTRVYTSDALETIESTKESVD